MATRPAIHSTEQLTSTTQTALVVGAAIGSSTGTGGANLGNITLNAAAAPVTTAATLYNTAGVPFFGTVPVVQGSGTNSQIPKFTTGASGIIGDSIYSEANITTIKAGGIGIASQAQYDMVYASSATQLARVANGTTGQLWTATTSGAPSWQSAATYYTRLSGASGTDTSAGATNVSSISISGLTVLDTLVVYVRLGTTTAATAAPVLYNVTDSVVVAQLLAGNNLSAANNGASGSVVIGPRQTAATAILSVSDTGFGDTTLVPSTMLATFTTAWTGAWTLALRHGGVTPTGTFDYRWSVYKVSGQ